MARLPRRPKGEGGSRLPVPTDRVMTVMKVAAAAAVVVLVVWLVVTVLSLGGAAREAEAERDRLAVANEAQDEAMAKRDSAIGEANDKLKDAGEDPVTVEDQPVSAPLAEAAGQPVLTSADVVALIQAEVATARPGLSDEETADIVRRVTVATATTAAPAVAAQGEPVTVGDLRPVIAAEVAKVPAPADGRDGADGADGADAPPVTDAQLRAALSTLCGGSCVGPKGDTGAPGADSTVPGPAGPTGEDGRDGTDGTSITRVSCTGGDLTVTYSDGTTQVVNGAGGTVCGEAPPPEPTPEPSTTSTTNTEEQP